MSSQDIKVYLVPFAKDNYAYVLVRPSTGKCVIIDPGEAKPLLEFCKKKKLFPSQIWLTHHHQDHIGGAQELKDHFNLEVLAPELEKKQIPFATRYVSDLDLFHFGHSKVKVIETPGHTLGHISYWLYQDQILFCGDTLFSLGCGRLFEGTAKQMWNSLCKLRVLPQETLVYCGHEYTYANAKFAKKYDKENQALLDRYEQVKKLKAKKKPTLPITIGEELLTNPFLRADLPFWAKKFKLEDKSPDEVFAHLRHLKDQQ